MSTKKKAPYTDAKDILGRAMLVNVDIGVWEARKHDKEVTEEVNKRFRAGTEAGRYHKHLFGGRVPELSAVLNAAHALRMMHYDQTLPWTDTGWRLLPTANYFAYTEAYRAHAAELQETITAFIKRYPRLVRDAKAKLNGMFRAADYPSVVSLPDKFRVAVDFSPLPAEGDFRVDLPKEDMVAMEKSVRRRLQEAVTLAMRNTYERLGEVITELRSHLDDGKYLRDTMVTRIQEVAEALGRLNITADPTLEVVRTRALKELATLDVDGLRENEQVRNAAADKADDILKAMSEFYAPAGVTK